MKAGELVPLRRWADCLDGRRVPLNASERASFAGDIPYWGANGVVDLVAESLFDETLVLLGEDGAPFFDKSKPVAFLSTGPVWPNNHIHVLRPRRDIDARFLTYALNAYDYAAVISGSTRDKLTQTDMNGMLLPGPPVSAQRAIADFLDAETARIDELVAQRRTLAELASERLSAVVEHRVRDAAAVFGEAPLRHAADIVVGIVITPAAWYADSGVLALRGLNVKPGRLDLTETVHLTFEGHLHNQKSELCAKDVVVVRTGQAGAAAVVPAGLDGANCIDLLRIRPSANLDSHFLEAVLNSDWTQKHIGAHSVGSIQAHFNVGSLKQLPIPIPPVSVQVAIAAALEEAKRKHELLRSRCEVQLAVLQERKQALITSAVTGQLDLAREISKEAS